MLLGFTFTLLVAIMIGIIAGIWYLLSKSGRKRKRLLNILLIIFLIMGIAGLIGFSGFVVYIKTQADPKFEIAKLSAVGFKNKSDNITNIKTSIK